MTCEQILETHCAAEALTFIFRCALAHDDLDFAELVSADLDTIDAAIQHLYACWASTPE